MMAEKPVAAGGLISWLHSLWGGGGGNEGWCSIDPLLFVQAGSAAPCSQGTAPQLQLNRPGIVLLDSRKRFLSYETASKPVMLANKINHQL